MIVIADTNVLIRSAVRDDPAQTPKAVAALKSARGIAIGTSALCEFVWVLLRTYKFSRDDAAKAVRTLMQIDKVFTDKPAVEAGLQMLEAGGDFADGVIAYQGAWLGGEVFVSFDKNAVERVKAQGGDALLLK